MPSYYGHISNSHAWRLLFQKNACRVIPFVYMFLALTFSSMSRVTLTSPELFITVIKRKNKAKPNLGIDNRLVVTRGKRVLRTVKWVKKGAKCLVTDGKWTIGGEHSIMHTDIEL